MFAGQWRFDQPPEFILSVFWWGGIVGVLLFSFFIYCDIRKGKKLFPNLSDVRALLGVGRLPMQEAFKHLMLDSKWSLGRKIDPSENPGNSDNSMCRLYREMEDALYDEINNGYLTVCTGSQRAPSGIWGKDVVFDLLSLMGNQRSAVITDYKSTTATHWARHPNASVSTKEFFSVFPKSSLIERFKDSDNRKTRETMYEREFADGNR